MTEFLTLNSLYSYGVELTLCGFVLALIPMVLGIAIDGAFKIFKNL